MITPKPGVTLHLLPNGTWKVHIDTSPSGPVSVQRDDEELFTWEEVQYG